MVQGHLTEKKISFAEIAEKEERRKIRKVGVGIFGHRALSPPINQSTNYCQTKAFEFSKHGAKEGGKPYGIYERNREF